jgi:hypothetical protein
MNALSMESIFLILSGAVLAAGILYWFWSHIQLTQKKVQLLENAVFELRGLQGSGSPGSGSPGSGSLGLGSSPSVPVPEYKDDDEGELETGAEEQDESDWPPTSVGGSTPLSALDAAPVDLQPGGRIGVAQDDIKEVATDKDAQFRELFIQHEARVPTPQSQKENQKENQGQESLESMPVKELRRLAEQRGLTGVSELRKKELLAALRNQITSAPAPAPVLQVQSEEVVVERTLDLTDDAVILE